MSMYKTTLKMIRGCDVAIPKGSHIIAISYDLTAVLFYDDVKNSGDCLVYLASFISAHPKTGVVRITGCIPEGKHREEAVKSFNKVWETDFEVEDMEMVDEITSEFREDISEAGLLRWKERTMRNINAYAAKAMAAI